jgi:hypothetical protein
MIEEKPIRVLFYQEGNCWRADPVNMPGSPLVGRGSNKREALGDLIMVMSGEPEWRKLGWPFFVFEDK